MINKRSNSIHSFMCGQLDVKISREIISKADNKWEIKNVKERDYNDHCNFYYKGFVDSLFAIGGGASVGFYKELAELKYTIKDKVVSRLKRFSCDGTKELNSYEFQVESITLYLFPHNIVLYSIEIMESDMLLNDMTFLHGMLRNVTNYENFQQIKVDNSSSRDIFVFENYLEVIDPLFELCKAVNGRDVKMTDLAKNGNKLKIFQIVESEDLSDDLLYEVATLSQIGLIDDSDNDLSPSTNYFDSIMKEHKIEPFKSWKALAIFDTVTALYKQGKGFSEYVWLNYYFRLVYIHVLYQKSILFELNQEFRAAAVSQSDISGLVDKIRDHECYYGFSHISYNFQPQLIYEQVLKGLNIDSERVQLRYYLEQENERREKEKEKRALENERIEKCREKEVAQKEKEIQRQGKRNKAIIAGVLSVIAILSITSALNDGTSLYMVFNDYKPASCCVKTFIIYFAIFITVVVSAVVWYYIKRQNNENKTHN